MKQTQYPLISIILPCYNSEEYILSATQSIQNQTYPNIEIVVVDDCSTDSSFSILEKLSNEDNRIKLFRNEANIKLIDTLNKAISLANGHYIARMDSDDISNPNRLLLQYQFLKENADIDIVSCTCDHIETNGKFHSHSLYYNVFQPNSCRFTALLESPILHTGLLCKREILLTHPYKLGSQNLHVEDYELWTRLLLNNYKFAILPKSLYLYRRNPDGVSNKFKSIQNTNQLACSQNYILQFLKIEVPLELLELLSMKDLKKPYSYLKAAVKLLKEFQETMFLKNNILITRSEKHEIIWWRQERTIRMSLLWAFKNKSIKNFLYTSFIVLSNANFFTKKRSCIFIFYTVQWIINQKLRK